jgi:hypothetical protein
MYIGCMEVAMRQTDKPFGPFERAMARRDEADAAHNAPATRPEPGEEMVSDGVWVETERLTDDSLVFNVWIRNDGPRAKGWGQQRVCFAVEPSGAGDWATWTRAHSMAQDLARITSLCSGWQVDA